MTFKKRRETSVISSYTDWLGGGDLNDSRSFGIRDCGFEGVGNEQ